MSDLVNAGGIRVVPFDPFDGGGPDFPPRGVIFVRQRRERARRRKITVREEECRAPETVPFRKRKYVPANEPAETRFPSVSAARKA